MTEPWFLMKADEMGREVELITEGFKSEQGGRRAEYIANLEKYEGRKMQGYTAHSYAYIQEGLERAKSFEGDRLRLVRSALRVSFNQRHKTRVEMLCKHGVNSSQVGVSVPASWRSHRAPDFSRGELLSAPESA